MKYAFIHKNIRRLPFEMKVILAAHLLTVIICFFPWLEAQPAYGDAVQYSAFSGPSFLIGTFIFLISVAIILLLADQVADSKKIRLPWSQKSVFLTGGIQQVVLFILAWSVLFSTAKEWGDAEIRFGIFVGLMAQIVGLVATFLHWQNQKQSHARSFFQHPSADSSKNKSNTPKSS
jgi:hypothetical protein